MPTRHHEGQTDGRAWRAEDGNPGQWQEKATMDGPQFGQEANEGRTGQTADAAPAQGEPTPHEESLGIYAHGRDEPEGPVWGGPSDGGSGRLPPVS